MKTFVQSLRARFRGMSRAGKGILFLVFLGAGLVLVPHLSGPVTTSDARHATPPLVGASSSEDPSDAELKAEWQRLKESSKLPRATSAPAAATMGALVDNSTYGAPIIAHAAELALATKEFSRSRSTLEDILERHHGYAAKLRMVGQASGSVLTATLRVPSSEFAWTVTDLKALGNVEREEQTADEITQQRADVEARLANAQNTLQRLQGILAKHEKKVAPADLQRQLQIVTAEIARLEAERVASEHQAIFANVLLSLREERTPPVESFGTQFRAAVLLGMSDALNSLSGILLFAISHGPVILLWTLLLFFPSRWIWRKWNTSLPTEPSRTAHSA